MYLPCNTYMIDLSIPDWFSALYFQIKKSEMNKMD
jgi:hypothetical protein